MEQLLWPEYKQKESGTHGRVWYTDQVNNIAFSFFLKVNCKINQLKGFTIEIANTLVETFQQLYSIDLTIKYPNDIAVGNKKLGGILTEIKSKGECIQSIVVGIGINTNQEVFTKEIAGIATSIKNEFGIEVDNDKIISKFCELFEEKITNRKEIRK